MIHRATLTDVATAVVNAVSLLVHPALAPLGAVPHGVARPNKCGRTPHSQLPLRRQCTRHAVHTIEDNQTYLLGLVLPLSCVTSWAANPDGRAVTPAQRPHETKPGDRDEGAALFNILDPTFRIDSPEIRVAAAANWWAPTSIGVAVLRYQQCLALLRDRRLRQGSLDTVAAYGVTSGVFAEKLGTSMLTAEGPAHQRLRRLVSAAFTQRSVDMLRPFMRAKAHELIDGFASSGRCEFMAAFADPYPAWVIAELLGIPAERFDAFLGWATDIGLGFSPAAAAEQDRINAAVTGLLACCDELLTQDSENPGDGLVSTLITAETEGQRLTSDELRALISTLVAAGQDTTRNQLGLAMTTFARHPEQWRLLAQRPELASTAVEELMRVNPVIPVITRRATEDFTFEGLHIAAGTHVALFIATANTDPETFGDVPFDITAQRATQLTFGGGIHYCLGNWLARMEMREALPILASRLGDIALDGPIVSRPHVGITGPITLPLRFATSAR